MYVCTVDTNIMKKDQPPHTIVKICVLHFKILLYDVCLLIFDCKKRLQYLNLLNHRTFVLKHVSSMCALIF